MKQGLDSITGQTALKELLNRSLSSGRISHAYILEGDLGMGKKTLAYAFARQLVCENKSGCGICPHCRLALSGNHPDIITVTPPEGKQNISVDSIRALYESVMIKPFSADKKIIIIPGCEKMGPQAQNALLKMLEEPPSYVVFILLTSNSNYFLDTVLSRSIKLTMQPYTDSEIRSILAKNGHPDASETIVSCADGNAGKALALISNDAFLSMRKELVSLFNLFFEDKPRVFDIISYFEANKDFADDIFDIFLSFARELVFSHIGTENVSRSGDFPAADYIERTTLKGTMAFLNIVIESKKMLLSNVNFTLLANSFVLSSREVLGW